MKQILILAAGLFHALIATPMYAQEHAITASSTPLRYESVFSEYRPQQDVALLPWKELFTAEGEFASIPEQSTSDTQAAPNAERAKPTQIAQADSAPPKASDTRGRIESINAAEGKVKLKHGPIPKFDMPGMTMVFRVADPTLLTQIKAGEEVGVTLEKSGSAFVITGFQK